MVQWTDRVRGEGWARSPWVDKVVSSDVEEAVTVVFVGVGPSFIFIGRQSIVQSTE